MEETRTIDEYEAHEIVTEWARENLDTRRWLPAQEVEASEDGDGFTFAYAANRDGDGFAQGDRIEGVVLSSGTVVIHGSRE